jgi:23S rRNA (cytosine1962-C5)-methyltransferase
VAGAHSSNIGGFALALAAACSSVEALDVSADAVATIASNALKNRLPHVQAREANAFDELRRLEKAGARYETVVLDPPAFAKNKASVEKALSGYKDINLRALRLLEPGGFLVTCSCSHHVNEDTFAEVVHAAAADAGSLVSVVEQRTQGRDHPLSACRDQIPEVPDSAETGLISAFDAVGRP